MANEELIQQLSESNDADHILQHKVDNLRRQAMAMYELGSDVEGAFGKSYGMDEKAWSVAQKHSQAHEKIDSYFEGELDAMKGLAEIGVREAELEAVEKAKELEASAMQTYDLAGSMIKDFKQAQTAREEGNLWSRSHGISVEAATAIVEKFEECLKSLEATKALRVGLVAHMAGAKAEVVAKNAEEAARKDELLRGYEGQVLVLGQKFGELREQYDSLSSIHFIKRSRLLKELKEVARQIDLLNGDYAEYDFIELEVYELPE